MRDRTHDKEYGIAKYNELKSKGLCTKCFHKPVYTKTLCKSCANKHNLRDSIHKKELNNKGLCVTGCGRKIEVGKSRCSACLWKQILSNRKFDDGKITQILENQNYTCPISGRKLGKGINASIDHITPIGAKHRKDKNYFLNKLNNIQILDNYINRAKQNLSDEQFIQLCQEVTEYQAKKKYAEQQLNSLDIPSYISKQIVKEIPI